MKKRKKEEVLLLVVMFAPTYATGDSFELDHVFLAFVAAEMIKSSITLAVELSSSGFDVLSTECTGSFFSHVLLLLCN